MITSIRLRLVEFVNQVEAWNPQFELNTHAVQQLTNDHHYALACFSAKFYARLSIKCQRSLPSIACLTNSNICRQ